MRKNVAIRGQQGFTLIELVVVIVILGILAATALPRFANLQSNSRIAAMNGVVGAVNSAIAISHAQALVSSQTASTGSVTMDGGATVALVYGYPDASSGGLGNAVSLSGFTPGYGTTGAAGGTATIDFPTAITGCQVKYTAATSAAGVVTAPTVQFTNTGGTSC